MKKHIGHLIYSCLTLMGLLSSCGEDRSEEYYTLIATKTWNKEVMQEKNKYKEEITENATGSQPQQIEHSRFRTQLAEQIVEHRQQYDDKQPKAHHENG